MQDFSLVVALFMLSMTQFLFDIRERFVEHIELTRSHSNRFGIGIKFKGFLRDSFPAREIRSKDCRKKIIQH